MQNKKWAYLVEIKSEWRQIRYFPLTRKQVEECVEDEFRPCKIITWREALKRNGIKPAQPK